MTQNLDVKVCEEYVHVSVSGIAESRLSSAAFVETYFEGCLLQREIKYFGTDHESNNS